MQAMLLIARWGLAPGIERFLDKIRTGKEMGFTAEEARHVIEIIEAAEKSGKEGKVVELRTGF